mmetsp:Transcript_43759/g.103387  ORF Transcript_43759/g.103387 Transcript_43759/m.103387 type:complete len:185 (-) Transcript_43759:108-662(-)
MPAGGPAAPCSRGLLGKGTLVLAVTCFCTFRLVHGETESCHATQVSERDAPATLSYALLQGVSQRASIEVESDSAVDARPIVTQKPTTTPMLIFPIGEGPAPAAGTSTNGNASNSTKDCILTEWSEWGECQEPPDDGMISWIRKRTRDTIQPWQEGGKPCEATEQVLTCQFGGYEEGAEEETEE